MFTILLVTMIFPATNSYAINSICSNSGQNGTQIRTCMHSYMEYQKMNRDTDNSFQSSLDNMRHELKSNQIKSDPNQTLTMILEKKQMAKQQWYEAFQNRIDYTKIADSDTGELLAKYHSFLKEQPIPVKPVTCPAWHEDCGLNSNPYTSTTKGNPHTNMTSITLKPEMQTHPSGMIENIPVIKNMNDLQAWMTNNIKLKNFTK